MPEIDLLKTLTPDRLTVMLRVAVWLLIGIPLVYMLSRIARRQVGKKLSGQQGLIASKAVFYLGLAFMVFSSLNEMGFKLTNLVAAAGVAGIAIGFAAQTSISNIISGFFLIAEQPFVIGDLIEVSGITGEVLSIDTLSIKLRTFDNRYVRIPNETIIKTEVQNITHFPIRRLDVKLSVAYKEDIGRVREILVEIATQNPICLQEPEPLIVFDGFGSSSIDMLLGVWCERKDYLQLKNSIQDAIKKRFDDEGIEIPFPHLSIYKGSISEPFPVSVVETKAS